MCCQVDNWFAGTGEKSGSGRLINDLPIKQCAGISTKISLGSDEREEIGLEFKIPSIVKVLSSSNVKRSSPTTRLKWCLNSFTVDSHSPPKCGAMGGIKRHYNMMFN